MSHTMKVQPFDVLLDWILQEYQEKKSIFGLPANLFYMPPVQAPYACKMFGQDLATPLGPAAGPHTQLTQNIIASWLSGGRFMELKTVQIMDELELGRPCIDMEDEGFNVEWSQELKLEQSVQEYVKAWALVHILHDMLGMQGPVGTIFNMSIGYNLEGIMSDRMQTFIATLLNASQPLAAIRTTLQQKYPQFAHVKIPDQIVNSVTLSTMHGCPPEEIGKIAKYLLAERKFHTIVKLNPTLLGKEFVLDTLQNKLGYTYIDIKDEVFDHDTKYSQALEIVKELRDISRQVDRTFGVKLTNTLANTNVRDIMPGGEMYMSGRALFPLSVNLFHKFMQEFEGDLLVSYSAGADTHNFTQLLQSGACPVTVASDLLKPGGYSKMVQYLQTLAETMQTQKANSLTELAGNKMQVLAELAADSLVNPRYKKEYHFPELPKVSSALALFDCIEAPCTQKCAVCQDVPEYAWQIAQGQADKALETILARNPLPAVTGYVCNHLCQDGCTRNNYDQPVAIRALKRYAAEKGTVKWSRKPAVGKKVAVIGAGPSGLAAASFLAWNGVAVTVFEAKERAGGMMGIAPRFRVPPAVVQEDVQRIQDLGVEINYNHPVTGNPAELLKQGFDAVYLGCGFPKEIPLDIPGTDAQGVYSGLELLEEVAAGRQPALGKKAIVIGGGNTAMDVSRMAARLTGNPVTVAYRRTKREMPAIDEEKELLFEEGNQLEELATPLEVLSQGGKVIGLKCLRNRLGEPDASGRRSPVPIPGSEFVIDGDSLVIAIGQAADGDWLQGSTIRSSRNGAIVVDAVSGCTGENGVYAGGDAIRGADIVIRACADGRKAAEAMCQKWGLIFAQPTRPASCLTEAQINEVKAVRAQKQDVQEEGKLPPEQRKGFTLVEQTFTDAQAQAEAKRCLQCSSFCDKCVEVCPNRANLVYHAAPALYQVPRVACRDGALVVSGQEHFALRQGRQILHLDDFCNECGNCASFCVHQGKPYLDKPRLFLKEQDYRLEQDNAFFLKGSTLYRRENGQEYRLTRTEAETVFEAPQFTITFTPDLQVVKMEIKQAFQGELSLQRAAEMDVLLKAIPAAFTYLPLEK